MLALVILQKHQIVAAMPEAATLRVRYPLVKPRRYYIGCPPFPAGFYQFWRLTCSSIHVIMQIDHPLDV